MDQSQAQRGHEQVSEIGQPEVVVQAAGQPAIPIEVLQDRYDGLLVNLDGKPAHVNQTHGIIGDYNKLQLQLDSVLDRLVEGTARASADDLQGVDFVGELEKIIRDYVVRRVFETGVAR